MHEKNREPACLVILSYIDYVKNIRFSRIMQLIEPVGMIAGSRRTSMRLTILGLAFLLVAVGCQTTGNWPSVAPQRVLRCGGTGPGGYGIPEGMREAVTRGTETEFFKALSRQSIEIKPGVVVQQVAGPDGKVNTLIFGLGEKQARIACSCPGGCTTCQPNDELCIGCITVVTDPATHASCGGDCISGSTCCFGCGFWQ